MRGARLRAAILGLLALAVAAAPAPAAAQPAAIDVLSDPPGDVRVDEGGTGTANPTPRLQQLDLRAARVQETPTDLVVTLQVASLDASSEPPLAESAFYSVHFLHADVHYSVDIGRIKSQDVGVFAQLSRHDPTQERAYAVDYLPVAMDAAAGTFTVTVPRDLVVDSHGARPYPGVALTGFWAESAAFLEIFGFPLSFAGQPPPTIRDRMPDTGEGPLPVTIALGPVQTGSARLSSPLPMRQSNGEATTFLFTVEARNVGEAADRYRLSAVGVPPGWQVTLQEPVVDLGAGEGRNLPVLVSVPFAHEHGTAKVFRLRLESVADAASHAEIELGVRYPRVPQPAGHHPMLFLHGAKWTDDPTVTVFATAFSFNTEYAWMNALQEDPGDEGVPVPADPRFDFPPPVPGTFRWTVALSPDLAMGLDFDVAGKGSFSGEFEATSPLLQAALGGELVYEVDSRFNEFGERVGGNRTRIATLSASAPQDILPGGRAGYTVEVTPTPEADLLPFRERSALLLRLNLTGMRPDTFAARDPPRLLPGATLHLPLFEYHDPVDAAFAATTKLRLAADVQDRLVNPGETALYRLRVETSADAPAAVVRLRIEGEEARWARLLEAPERSMGPGEAWDVPLAVAVPADAPALHSVDLIVHAQAGDDPSMRALVRLFATVVTDRDVPDDAELAASLRKAPEVSSPSPGVLAALLVAGLAAVLRRRQA